nr:glycosyltransferase family 2 protein [Saprospiraceae bacterium]
MRDSPEISVIISTYNAPDWLSKTLEGYRVQEFKDFELVIADDGSEVETKDLIAEFASRVEFTVTHVWHEDHGFQKTKILNKAILASRADYLLMSDGDCIPRSDFLEVHMRYREPGYFLSGGYHKLPMSISESIDFSDIQEQRCFDLGWLKKKGMKSSVKNLKFNARGFTQKLLNALTPAKASWNGHNASGWKSDILKINGFDERMQYGGEDRELGERLINLGIKSKQIRYSAICIHLDHERGYKNEESIEKNLAIRKITKKERKTWTDFGVEKTTE